MATMIIFKSIFLLPNLVNFHVYDKWGTRVFYESNFANRWFGTSNKGEKLENGVYSYLVTNMTEKTIQKGTITIKK
jgi:hypothetical protein